MAELNVNGKKYKLDVDPETPLLWVIREQIGLTGTKYGCGIGACGACTVLFEGQAVRSCAIPVAAVEGKKLRPLKAWKRMASYLKYKKLGLITKYLSAVTANLAW